MNRSPRAAVLGGVVVAGLMLLGTTAGAQGNGSIYTQCPGDTNGDGDPGRHGRGPSQRQVHAPGRRRRLRHDGGRQADLHVRLLGRHRPLAFPGGQRERHPAGGLAAANYPAPTIHLKEGQEFYLSLTNVGMILRPDLFDPHSVHFHGFPQAASVFDGVPESSATINMGSTFTYYYNIVDGLAGTYMYHCHVEATEHIQMGMVGNLYIDPRQNDCGTPANPAACPAGHHPGLRYVYNDGDGSTAYDVEYPIQLGGVDANFHDQHIAIQPLPFAAMDDKYAMLNGRGYPDTVNAGRDHHRRRLRQPAVAARSTRRSRPRPGRGCCCASRTSRSRASTRSARRSRCTSSATTRSCCAGRRGPTSSTTPTR